MNQKDKVADTLAENDCASTGYVYKFIDIDDRIIYIGKSKDIIQRLTKQHFTWKSHLPKACYDETEKILYAEFGNMDEASIYERYLINKYCPEYNRQYNNKSAFSFGLPEVEWNTFAYRKCPCSNCARRTLSSLAAFEYKEHYCNPCEGECWWTDVDGSWSEKPTNLYSCFFKEHQTCERKISLSYFYHNILSDTKIIHTRWGKAKVWQCVKCGKYLVSRVDEFQKYELGDNMCC